MNSRPGVTTTTDMAVLPGVHGCRTLRRTVQVRLGTDPAVPRDGCPVHTHLRGLTTAIHEISGRVRIMNRTREVYKERHRGKVIGDFGLGIAD